MSTSSAELRRRISAVESAEKIVSALRLVAAARIRASSNAALRARPFADELQTVLAQLIDHINVRGIDIIAIAQGAPPFTVSDMHGPLLADPIVQKALLNRMYLAVFKKPFSNFNSSSSSATAAALNTTILTVVSADRKFCGSYNKDVITRATQRIIELTTSSLRTSYHNNNNIGTNVELVLVGRIARTHFDREWPSIPVRAYLPGPSSLTAESLASDMSQTLLSEFIGGGVQRVEIVYTKFVSLITTIPSMRTLLPLTPTGMESVGDELFQLSLTSSNGRIIPKRVPMRGNHHHHDHHSSNGHHHHHTGDEHGVSITNGTYFNNASSSTSRYSNSLKETLYSISDEDAILLLNSMVPMYFTSQLIRIVRESLASEQVSRLAAMTAATDNARELITTLKTQYNKQRQARITTEIIEVIGNVASY